MSYPGEPPPQDPNAPQQQYPQQYPPQYPPPPGYYPAQPYAVPPPTHGMALASMIVGIVSLVLACGYGIGFLGSPVAWFLGAKAKKEIDASGGQLGGRGMAQAGFVMGIIGTVLLVLSILVVAAILVFALNSDTATY